MKLFRRKMVKQWCNFILDSGLILATPVLDILGHIRNAQGLRGMTHCDSNTAFSWRLNSGDASQESYCNVPWLESGDTFIINPLNVKGQEANTIKDVNRYRFANIMTLKSWRVKAVSCEEWGPNFGGTKMCYQCSYAEYICYTYFFSQYKLKREL